MISDFLIKLKQQPESISFSEVMTLIEQQYDFTETEFKNGDTLNLAGQNSGSCKLFAFAQLQQLNQAETLALFGDYYRQDVLLNPTGEDHQNIRNFMKYGWQGIQFNGQALSLK